MNGYKINITDILGSIKININTPIIILSNVSKKYLIPSQNNQSVYNIDIDTLHNDLESQYQFIDRFIPIGQIYMYGSNKKLFTIIMANTRIIPSTRNFDQIKKNIWIGILRKNDKINRSIGTIYSESRPDFSIPVFPDKFLKKVDDINDDLNRNENNIYANIYSDKIYGRWIIDNYKFNINKSHLKMIDSSGEISNMFIPSAMVGMNPSASSAVDMQLPSDYIVNQNSENLRDLNRNNNKRLSHKVYFSAQGAITNDTNHESRTNNQEATYVSAMPSDDDTIEINDNSVYSDVFSLLQKTKLTKSGKSLILKEKEEPWFTDSMIVGSAASIDDPHKITGHISSIEDGTLNDGTLCDGTVYNNVDYEINAPYTSDNNKKYRDNQKPDSIENFNESETNMDYLNNNIMYIMCIILIILIMYRMIDKK